MKPKARTIYMDEESYAHLRAIAKQKKTSISTMVIARRLNFEGVPT